MRSITFILIKFFIKRYPELKCIYDSFNFEALKKNEFILLFQ